MDRFRRLKRIQRIRNRPQITLHLTRHNLRDMQNPVECLSNVQFKNRYRFSKSVVLNYLVPLLEPLLSSVHGKQTPILFNILLALRFYATGSFQLVIADTFFVAQSSVCRSIKNVSRTLASLRPQFIQFPNHAEAINIRTQFYKMSGFPGITGVVDGTLIRIVNPGGIDPEVFRCRKGYFAINVQGICKPDLKFSNIVVRWKGSTHDSRVFDNSRISTELDDNSAPGHLIGDLGYPLRKYILTKYWNPTKPEEKRYNRAHSLARNCIERAFGVLKKRFHCTGSIIRTKLKTTLPVIVACMVLHNISIEVNDPWESDGNEPDEDDEAFEYQINVTNLRADLLGKIARQRITDQYFKT